MCGEKPLTLRSEGSGGGGRGWTQKKESLSGGHLNPTRRHHPDALAQRLTLVHSVRGEHPRVRFAYGLNDRVHTKLYGYDNRMYVRKVVGWEVRTIYPCIHA